MPGLFRDDDGDDDGGYDGDDDGGDDGDDDGGDDGDDGDDFHLDWWIAWIIS